MTIGVVGRKRGMTRIFTEDGQSVPVTVIEVDVNRVTQLRTVEKDGYRAIQVTTGTKKPSRLTKPEAGHFAKNGVEPGRGLWEFRLDEGEGEDLEVGATIGVDLFSEGQFVDVTGTTIGKGFAGTIKRHHFNSQDASHGNSLSHRVPGSIGQCQTPGRVFKGKRMAGQMGNVNRVQQNLEIVRIDTERNLLLVRGGVPGPAGGRLVVLPSIKQKHKG